MMKIVHLIIPFLLIFIFFTTSQVMSKDKNLNFSEKYETAVVAGGCFWGVEDILRQQKGIIETDVGYAGGDQSNATYEFVKTGKTGLAEAVKISFDPAILSYGQLLDIFFRLHDPTTLNQQGNDIGTQYRSAIFAENQAQEEEAVKAIARAAVKWKKPITTKIETNKKFFLAEDYHQDYLKKNPDGYTCHFLRD
jgi:methionine-S-sulfoxide reductase